MWARFITTDYVALFFFAVLYQVYGGDAQAVSPCEECENDLKTYRISLFAVSSVGAVEFIIILILVGVIIRCFCARQYRAESSNTPEKPVKHGISQDDKDRISNYELWTLAGYAFQIKEKKKFKVYTGNLLDALGLLRSESYGSTEDLYVSLRRWKEKCRNQSTNEPDQLYEACIKAGMTEIARKLRDLRVVVSDVEGVTSMELEHILWQIGTRSANHADNINRLLKALGIEKYVHPNPSLKKPVEDALKILEAWKEEFISFNPVVILSLKWEDFEFETDEPDFFRVPQEEKQELPDTKVSKYAHDATIRHCNKLFSVIKSCGRDKGVHINQKAYENEKVLFDTRKMIKDWFEEQECSNYEKRRKLEKALEKALSTDEYRDPRDNNGELFTAKKIKERASGDESNRVSLAYELLMTDVIPFTRALGVDETKLQEYKLQSINSSYLKMGTIGLITILVEK